MIGRDAGRGLWKIKTATTPTTVGGTTDVVAGEDLIVGDLVYINGSGQLMKAQADALPQAMVYGIVTVAALSGATATVLHDGIIEQVNWTHTAGTAALIPGARYFLDPLSAGNMSTTSALPGTSGVITFVGTALSATKFHFEREQIIKRNV